MEHIRPTRRSQHRYRKAGCRKQQLGDGDNSGRGREAKGQERARQNDRAGERNQEAIPMPIRLPARKEHRDSAEHTTRTYKITDLFGVETRASHKNRFAPACVSTTSPRR